MNRPSADGRRRSGEMGESENRSGGLHAKAGQLLSQVWESRQAGLEQERVNSGFFVSLELPACRHPQIGPAQLPNQPGVLGQRVSSCWMTSSFGAPTDKWNCSMTSDPSTRDATTEARSAILVPSGRCRVGRSAAHTTSLFSATMASPPVI